MYVFTQDILALRYLMRRIPCFKSGWPCVGANSVSADSTTAEPKYSREKNISLSSKEQTLNLLCAYNYLHNRLHCIMFYKQSRDDLKYTGGFYMKDSSSSDFGILRVPGIIPQNTDGQLYFSFPS